jgi:branched-chain amino acid transport system substrate-binding protein
VTALMKQVGGTKVGILVGNNPAQAALGAGLQQLSQSGAGLKVVDSEKFDIASTDVTPQLQKLRAAGADVVAFDGAGKGNINTVMTGMQTLGWKVPVVAGPASLSGDLTTQVPAAVASQFHAVDYRLGVNTGAEPPATQKFITDLKANYPNNTITGLFSSAVSRDAIFIAKWGFELAQKDSGNTSSDSVKKAMETFRTSTPPADYFVAMGNPAYAPGDHTTSGLDYSKIWASVGVSSLTNGQYTGQALDVPSS